MQGLGARAPTRRRACVKTLATGCVRTFRLGSFIAAPPYLTTMVLPLNLCRYGRASERVDTRSSGVSLAFVAGAACTEQTQVHSQCASVREQLVRVESVRARASQRAIHVPQGICAAGLLTSQAPTSHIGRNGLRTSSTTAAAARTRTELARSGLWLLSRRDDLTGP